MRQGPRMYRYVTPASFSVTNFDMRDVSGRGSCQEYRNDSPAEPVRVADENPRKDPISKVVSPCKIKHPEAKGCVRGCPICFGTSSLRVKN